jgi:vacuolar-type H+-ATPase subunit F/Vma7
MSDKQETNVVYIGPPGGGLGFQLAGIDVMNCSDEKELLNIIREEKGGKYEIMFVDENLAENILPEIEKLNEDVLPAIVLIASSSSPKKIAARKMDQLLLKAVGSDIINK